MNVFVTGQAPWKPQSPLSTVKWLWFQGCLIQRVIPALPAKAHQRTPVSNQSSYDGQ
jgi:hypothetical protein